MNWRKLGRIYAPSGELWWAKSYAHLPSVGASHDDVIRVYFASLDIEKLGRIGYVDLDIDNPARIMNIAKEPVLDIGERGAFDDSGVNPSCILEISGIKYMYYIGWQRSERIPYLLFAGLATSSDGINFNRVSKTPVLERTSTEYFLRSATSVIYEGGVFKNWYVSGLKWILVRGTQYPSYVIKYAESSDGIHWESYNHTCIDFKDKHEFGFGRPWVIREHGVYKMWYSIRSRTSPYRIGYAESSGGIEWTRKDDEVGIDISEVGWDSEMICYPCILDVNGKRYMFYNGNQHGLTGFGYAILESD